MNRLGDTALLFLRHCGVKTRSGGEKRAELGDVGGRAFHTRPSTSTMTAGEAATETDCPAAVHEIDRPPS